MRRLRPHVMLIVAAAALACALACIFLPGPIGVRVPFGLALLLVLPGYAIWSALFPRPEDPVLTATFSVGLSVVVAIIAGVEIGAYDLYSTETWAGLMAGITVCAALIARARRPADLARPSPAPEGRRVRVHVGAIATGVAALLLIGVAIGVARTPLPVPEDRGYTEFSLGQTAVGAESISLRIASSEAGTRSFRLTLEMPGRASEDRIVIVAPGQVVNEEVAVPNATGGAIVASLRDASAPADSAPYRNLRIGLPVQGPAPGAADVVDGSGPGR